MARTHPVEPDPSASPAERYVFGKLRDGLPEGWLVVHSTPFFRPGRDGRPGQEGEVDFLILDPERGYLALEVKGGGIRRDRGDWTSRGRDGVERRIADPARQASLGVRAIPEYLAGRPFFRQHPWPGFAWGVCLPDVDVAGPLGPELPPKRRLVMMGKPRGHLARPSPHKEAVR